MLVLKRPLFFFFLVAIPKVRAKKVTPLRKLNCAAKLIFLSNESSLLIVVSFIVSFFVVFFFKANYLALTV